MKKTIFVAIVLAGCSTSHNDIAFEREKGELRRELFVECMELAAKNGRSADDDVSDIVGKCNDHSLYLANSMRPKP